MSNSEVDEACMQERVHAVLFEKIFNWILYNRLNGCEYVGNRRCSNEHSTADDLNDWTRAAQCPGKPRLQAPPHHHHQGSVEQSDSLPSSMLLLPVSLTLRWRPQGPGICCAECTRLGLAVFTAATPLSPSKVTHGIRMRGRGSQRWEEATSSLKGPLNLPCCTALLPLTFCHDKLRVSGLCAV